MPYLTTRFLGCLLAVSFVALSMVAFGQATGGITGIVVDETGAAIEGARITISDENDASRATTVTRNDGSFAVTGLPFGRYRVKAESNQFQLSQSEVVIVESSATPSINLKLQVRSVTQEVTVTAATRSDVKIEDLPVSASVVTSEAVRDSAAQSLDQLLLTVPGINLQEPPSFAQHPTANAVSMRGLGGERTLVLLDGVPLNDAFFGYVQWNRVPLDSVDRVEVVRGDASSL